MGAVDTLQAGNAPSFKFEKVGDRIKGRIVALGEKQDSDFQDPSKLKWWNRPDGPDRGNPTDRPKMIVVITLQTELNDGTEEDDGTRSVWLRGNAISATRDALRKVFGAKKYTDDDLVGGTFWLVHHALGTPPQRGMNAPKLFQAKFEKRNVVEAAADAVEANGAGNQAQDAAAMDW